MSFVDDAITRCKDRWRFELEHPFVLGIGDGTLPQDRFRHYLRQDYVFLQAYCRVLALAAAEAGDLETMARFADLLRQTLGEEMALHRAVCAGYGVDEAALEATEPAATCRAYTEHLLSAAREGDLALLCAALLPCALGYAWIGRKLEESGANPPVQAYREWIQGYASPAFQAWAQWLAALTDRLAAGRSEAALERMCALFAESVEHEIRFWEMAWNLEGA